MNPSTTASVDGEETESEEEFPSLCLSDFEEDAVVDILEPPGLEEVTWTKDCPEPVLEEIVPPPTPKKAKKVKVKLEKEVSILKKIRVAIKLSKQGGNRSCVFNQVDIPLHGRWRRDTKGSSQVLESAMLTLEAMQKLTDESVPAAALRECGYSTKIAREALKMFKLRLQPTP